VSEGASVQGCMFNTENGPVFIGKNALLMEGGIFRGPLAIMDGAVVKMGATIYGGTTLGVKSTAGGEIKNSILGDYSNKAHHGYLGDSIVGQWCNLGAGTSNSNVKNNAGAINMWSESVKNYISVGQKAGMAMGDFSKTAINSSINTGACIGCCASIHYTGLTEKSIRPFAWGEEGKYDLNKLLKDISAWMFFKREYPAECLLDTIRHLYQTG
jgi:NDP-sugar pyrophosphorylase family protein